MEERTTPGREGIAFHPTVRTPTVQYSEDTVSHKYYNGQNSDREYSVPSQLQRSALRWSNTVWIQCSTTATVSTPTALGRGSVLSLLNTPTTILDAHCFATYFQSCTEFENIQSSHDNPEQLRVAGSSVKSVQCTTKYDYVCKKMTGWSKSMLFYVS